MRVRPILCAILAFSAAVVVAPGASDRPVLVGFASTLTGKQSFIGVDGRDGMELAVEHANEAGGIHGRPIHLLVADDGGDVEIAIREDIRLVDQGASVIIGHSISAMAPAVEAVMAEREVLFFSPTMSTPDLSGKDDYFFRISPGLHSQADGVARTVADAGLKSLAVIYDSSNASYALPLLARTKGRLAELSIAFGPVVQYDSRTVGSYLDVARQATGADGVFLLCNGFDAAALAQQLRKVGYEGRLFGTNWAKISELLEEGGPAVEGMVLVAAYESEEPEPALVEFTSAFEERFGKPPGFSARLTYEAAMALFEAMEAARTLRPEDIKDSLLSIRRFRGLELDAVLDRYGDGSRASTIFRIENGEYGIVGTVPVSD